MFIYIFIFSLTMCTEIKEGTDESKLMIEVKMTVIIPGSYRCVEVKRGGVGRWGRTGAVPQKETHCP